MSLFYPCQYLQPNEKFGLRWLSRNFLTLKLKYGFKEKLKQDQKCDKGLCNEFTNNEN